MSCERAAEPARAVFGEERFAALRTADVDAMRRRLGVLSAALGENGPSNPRWRGCFATPPGKAVGSIAAAAAAAAFRRRLARRVCSRGGARSRFRAALADRLAWAEHVQAMARALDRLRAARAAEQLACELTRIAEESAHNSLELWQSLAAPLAQPVGSGTAQAAQRIRLAAADDLQRRPL